MRKQLVLLLIVAAALSVAGVAGAQSPDPTDDTRPESPETTLPADPEEDVDEEAPLTTESTTSTTPTTTTAPPETTTTTGAPVIAADPPAAEVAGLQQGGCHPSYQGACVPVSADDVNCPSIPANDFKVVGPDVYDLDGNSDGVACESDGRSGDDAAVAAPTATTSSGAPDKLAATGSSSEHRYLLSLALVAAGLFAILISAAVAPEIVVPRRGGFTVTKVNHSGDEIRTRITGDRAGRRSRR